METENIKCQICEGKFKKELIVKKPDWTCCLRCIDWIKVNFSRKPWRKSKLVIGHMIYDSLLARGFFNKQRRI